MAQTQTRSAPLTRPAPEAATLAVREFAQVAEQPSAQVASDGATVRVLVIGDSTAAGTGAPPGMSVPARLARAFPGAHVDNLGVDGAVLRDTLHQLEADSGPQPHVLLIMAGGNDVVRLASAGRMARELEALLEAALQRAPRVILMSPGNLASAPGLWWPLDRVLGWRSRTARDVFEQVASRHPVLHVSMYRERAVDPFAQEPTRYFSDDGIHPSAEGYALWFEALRRQAPLDAWLEP